MLSWQWSLQRLKIPSCLFYEWSWDSRDFASLDSLFLRVFWWFLGVCCWSVSRLCCCLLCSSVTEFLLHSFLCFSVGVTLFRAHCSSVFFVPLLYALYDIRRYEYVSCFKTKTKKLQPTQRKRTSHTG